MNPTYTILLYYMYARLKDPRALVGWHKGYCSAKGIKGRIIIAEEGLNGTIEGTTDAVGEYMKAIREYEDIDKNGGRFQPFKKMIFKISAGNGQAFPKLSVKLRNEIVSAHLGEDDIHPLDTTGDRLSPHELRTWIEEGRDFEIIDMRNDYEFKVGHFKNSINPRMNNFRDLPQVLPQLEPLKEKTVVTVCTGGVRCEKASGYLKKKGFTRVYQLDGGIVSYMNAYPGKDFAGALYVFDKRVVMDTTKEREVVGRCDVCQKSTEHYVNCQSATCHAHVLLCPDCIQEHNGKIRCGSCISSQVVMS